MAENNFGGPESSSSPVSSMSRGNYDRMHVYELRYSVLKDVSDLLDVNDKWKLLGCKMGFTIMNLLHIEQLHGHESCAMKMLLEWSMQNHTVDELFELLAALRMYYPMSLLKNYVSPRCLPLLNPMGVHDQPAVFGGAPVESEGGSLGYVSGETSAASIFRLPRPPLPQHARHNQQVPVQDTAYDVVSSFAELDTCSSSQSQQSQCQSQGNSDLSLKQKTLPINSLNNYAPSYVNTSSNLPEKAFSEQAMTKTQPASMASLKGNISEGRYASDAAAVISSKIQLPRPPLPFGSSSMRRTVLETLPSEPIEQVPKNSISMPDMKEKSSVMSASVESIVGKIPYDEIVEATKNFTTMELGRGGFGVVYEGHWKKLKVAIKKIENTNPGKPSMEDAKFAQSYVELKTLNQCRYDNVLPLYGYAEGFSPPTLCLVYQFMVNGSLEDRLLRRGGTEPLLWSNRLVIARGSARGLQYLHSCQPQIIHGDIKSANILLDVNMEPKLGDFGLARYGPASQFTHVNVTAIHGTRPYLPNDFMKTHELSPEVDTYSFGVVLLELATGLRAFVEDRGKNLRDYVANYDAAKYDELRDRLAGDTDDCRIFLVFIDGGRNCTRSNRKKRPLMAAVFETLDVELQALEARNARGPVEAVSDSPSSVSSPSPSLATEASDHQQSLPVTENHTEVDENEPEEVVAEAEADESNNASRLPWLTVLGTKPPSA